MTVATASSEMQNERTPLLQSESPPKTPLIEENEDVSRPLLTTTRKNLILITLAVLVLALGIGDELIQPAQTRVFEAIICRNFYDEHDPSVIAPGEHNGWWDDESRKGVLLGIQEQWCKVPQVQGDLAMLKGWDVGLTSLGSFILAVPWGWFADCYGRKPLMFMIVVAFVLKAIWVQCICYFWQTFQIKLIWVGALHSLLGGSTAVATAVLFTAVTDITTEAERTATFFRVGAASMCTMFIAPPISSVLMNRNPWFAMLLGLGIMALPLPCFLFLPETLKYRSGPAKSAIPTAATSNSHLPLWKRVSKAFWHVVHDSFAFISSDMRLFFLVCVYCVHLLLIAGVRDILLQYGSTRYDLSLAKSTMVLAIRSGVNLLFMLFILPTLSNYLNRKPAFSSHPSHVDLLLARASAVIAALGYLIIALAPNLPCYAIGLFVNTAGWGLMVYVRSLAASMVEPHAVARLFTLMGVMDTLGMVIGSPSLAGLFEAGQRWGGLWMGLPFLMTAAAAALIGIGLSTIGLEGWKNSRNGEEEEAVMDD